MIIVAAWLVCCAAEGAVEADTLCVGELEEVVVNGVRPGLGSPFAITELSEEVVKDFTSAARELPFLISGTVGAVSWSDNGMCLGPTYLRLRGSDDTRLSVSLDGIPLNSPEDGCVFWANMNSYSAFLGGIEVVRGVGSGVSGDGNLCGSVVLNTASAARERAIRGSVSYGSYDTFNGSASYCSGLLGQHFSVLCNYNHSSTGGYIDGTSGWSGSLYVGVGYVGSGIEVKYQNVFNYERMGQAWNGIETGDILDGNYGVATGIKDYSDMVKAGLGRWNSLVETVSEDGSGGYVITPLTLRDGSIWRKTTDNFYQDKSILSVLYNINKVWRGLFSVHYTRGYGYYEELKSACKLLKFGLEDYVLSTGEVLTKSDFIRKKGLDQDTFGARGEWSYDNGGVHLSGGGTVQGFVGGHFGDLTYVDNDELWASLGGGKYRYYSGRGDKWEATLHALCRGDLPFGIGIYGDVQYRWVHYALTGDTDKFVKEGNSIVQQSLSLLRKYHFFNPKGGITWQQRGHRLAASIGIAHREPVRNNFTDNGSYPLPQPERLVDAEVSYRWTTAPLTIDATLYYMRYHNALIQTGELSDIGEALTTNISSAFRCGIEVVAEWRPTKWLTINGNLALSNNRILDFTEVVDDWDRGSQTIHYDRSTLAYSPSCIANITVQGHAKGLLCQWHTNYVSQQYIDNTASKERSLPAYTTSDILIKYSFATAKGVNIVPQIQVNNIFNRHYAASAWVYSAIAESSNNPNEHRYREIGYYPMAGRTLLFSLTIHY